MQPRIKLQTRPLPTILAATLVATCSAPPSQEAPSIETAEISTEAIEAPDLPDHIFINLLPWGEIDFSRGEFSGLDTCTEFVRSLPNYSGYTTAERCEPLTDPIYCSVWKDGDTPLEQIGCFKGVGGCEVELRRHELLAESGSRTIVSQCEPASLADAWAKFRGAETTDLTNIPSP